MNALPLEFRTMLNAWVRKKYDELWQYAQIPVRE